MLCPICGSSTKHLFTETVLSKYEAHYRECRQCRYLYAEDPHWLNEAYASAIASSDTGLIMRNISIAAKLSSVLYWGLNERGGGRYVDMAGGYGMLVRLMRDFGFDFYWEDKYCANLFAQGFERKLDMGPCTAVTAFEVLEHLTDPIRFIRNSLSSAQSDTIIFSTDLYTGEPPRAGTWDYYSFATGQHIGFFHRKTLETIGEQLQLKFLSINGIHMFCPALAHTHFIKLLTGRLMNKISLSLIKHQLVSKTLNDSQKMLEKISLG